MKRTIPAIMAAALLAACATELKTTVPFNAAEVSYISSRGSADISGQAFMRQNGGGIVTCAGTDVSLLPAGEYATQRIEQLYGSRSGGRIGSLTGASQTNVPDQYLEMQRKTTCDAEGDFIFQNVANGDYYVISRVTWTVPGGWIPEGGTLAKLVQVRSSQSQRVLLN